MAKIPPILPPGDIDVAILTKELEVVFAEQLLKCTKTVKHEMEQERDVSTAATLEYLLSQIDMKFQHLKGELLEHVNSYLNSLKPEQSLTKFDINQVGNNSLDGDVDQAMNQLNAPPELNDSLLTQFCLSEEALSNPIDSVDHEGDVLGTPSVNVASYILQFSRVHPPEKLINDCNTGETLSYESLLSTVSKVASGLRRCGFSSTNSLAIRANRSSLRTLVVILAVWALGGTIVWATSNSQLVESWVCIDSDEQHAIVRDQPSVEHVLSLVDSIDAEVMYTSLLSEGETLFNPLKNYHPTCASHIAMTLYVDLPTGNSRIFSYTHRDIISAVDITVDLHRAQLQNMSMLAMIPSYSPEWLTFVLLPSIFYGTALHLLSPLSAAELPRILRSTKPAIFITSTLMLSELCKTSDAMSHVDEIYCIGISVPSLPRTLRALYTLTSKWKPTLTFRRFYASPATLGVGELCIRVGETNSFYQTNAMAYIDTEMQIHCIGSIDGVLNLGIESTTTLELEEILASHPLVDDALVVPLDGPVCIAYVRLATTASTYLEDALRSVSIFATKQLPQTKQVRQFHAVRDIYRAVDGQPYRSLVVQAENCLEKHPPDTAKNTNIMKSL